MQPLAGHQTASAVPLLDLLDDLRRRILWAVVALTVGTGVCWGYSDPLFRLLARPLTEGLAGRGLDPRLAYTRLADPFVLYLSVALAGGLVLAVPVVLAQVWWVLAPRTGSRRLGGALAFLAAGAVLFVAGVAFGHQILLPFVVGYLLGIAENLQQVLTARDFLRFALRLLVALGIAAQLPLLSFVLARVGLVNPRMLWRGFPYATLAAFVLAALLTPPDGVSQVVVAVPLLAVYVVSILVAALARRRRGP